MTALADVATLKSEGTFKRRKYNQPASTTLFHGALVMINAAGAAVPASNTAGNKGVKGVAEKTTVNAAGETQDVFLQRGKFWIPHTGLAAINIGETVFATDDGAVTVTGTNFATVGELLELDGTSALVDVGTGEIT